MAKTKYIATIITISVDILMKNRSNGLSVNNYY